ncbi:hypothetical protein [Thermococcus sp. 2319x1]|uniref:hypothetical protein n=1 Tax=Thermococcus sp. 2319x1 TaxID=1674923 RepID=UPI0015815A2E|nr:hypothetical protein [Thermococcus sp. 2319x1]
MLTAAEHMKAYLKSVGHVVGDALDRIYRDGIYLELKKDPAPLIEFMKNWSAGASPSQTKESSTRTCAKHSGLGPRQAHDHNGPPEGVQGNGKDGKDTPDTGEARGEKVKETKSQSSSETQAGTCKTSPPDY